MITAEWADWIEQQRLRIKARPVVGYLADSPACAEPVAMAALAAIAHRWREPAEAACRCLLAASRTTGAVSVRLNDEGPFWTTSLACLAWRRFELAWPDRARPWCADAYRRGLDFLLTLDGEKLDPSQNVGHNTQLVGWPWVQGTHSWLEPTALALLCLRHCEWAEHPRAIEAAELLVDRLLPSGGANYGNTYVLGQVLRPHVMPSAMCMVALHRSAPQPPGMEPTMRYLRDELSTPLASISLAWTMHALVSAEWEQAADTRTDFRRPVQAAIVRLQGSGENPHRQNMLLCALSQRQSPLLDLPPLRLEQPQDTNR